jgi:hypothetical protein
LLPVTLASTRTPENPAVVEAGPVLEVAAPLVEVATVVAAAPPPSSSPPQPPSRQPTASSPTTTSQRERLNCASLAVTGDTHLWIKG